MPSAVLDDELAAPDRLADVLPARGDRERERQRIAGLERVERRPGGAVENHGVGIDREVSGRGPDLTHDRRLVAGRGEGQRDPREDDVGPAHVPWGGGPEPGRVERELRIGAALVDVLDRVGRPVRPGHRDAHEDVPDERVTGGIDPKGRTRGPRRGHELPRVDVDPVRRVLGWAGIAAPHVPAVSYTHLTLPTKR